MGNRPRSISGQTRSTTTRRRARTSSGRGAAAIRSVLLQPEEYDRSPLQGILRCADESHLGRCGFDGVEDAHPLLAVAFGRQHERNALEMCVEQDQKRIAGHLAPVLVDVADGVTDY